MKFANFVLTVVTIVSLLSSCSLSKEPKIEILSEIYSRIMTFQYSNEGYGNIDYCEYGDLYIASLTEAYIFNEWDEKKWVFNELPRLEQETWENYLQENSQQILFPSNIDFGCKYSLIDIEKNTPSRSPDNCAYVFHFSQIGFNSQENQALVYRVTSCGDFAFGNLYFIEIVDSHWQVTDFAEWLIT